MNEAVETTDVAVVEPETAPTNALVALKPSSIPELVETVNAVDEAKKAIMLERRDFMTIPGCKQPSLLKPGAEKLLKLFNLGCRFFPIKEIEEHDKEYEYSTRYGKKSATGWYFYKYRAELFHLASGTVVGDGYATCSSNERPDQPANTIIKMAQKSAMVGAVLITCNASGLFTQDMEDFQQSSQPATDELMGNTQSQGVPKQTPDGNPRYASEKQLKYIGSLLDKVENMAPQEKSNIEEALDGEQITSGQASDLINSLKGRIS